VQYGARDWTTLGAEGTAAVERAAALGLDGVELNARAWPPDGPLWSAAERARIVARAGELGQRDGPAVAAGGGVAGGQDEVDAVGEEVVAVDAGRQPARLVLPLVGEHEVEVADRERGQRDLGLLLDDLAAQARRVAREGVHGGQGQVEDDGLEPGDARAAGDGPGGRGEVGLGELGALQQRLGVAGQDQRRVGQAHAATRALEQRHAGLALEHRELLGDGRRRELQRVGDRRHRPSLVELPEQAQAAEVQHDEAMLQAQ